MKKTKQILFYVKGVVVEHAEGDEFSIEDVEKTKACIAHIHGVSYNDIEITAKNHYVPELSNTIFVTHMGLCYKAPNNYSMFRTVDCPTVGKIYDFQYQDHIDEFLDTLSLYLKGNNSKEVDDFIILF